MGFFNKKKKQTGPDCPVISGLADTVLNVIADGVVVVDASGTVQMMNPAAVEMLGLANENSALGLDYSLVIKLENSEGAAVPDEKNPLIQAIIQDTPLSTREFVLASTESDHKTAVSIGVTPTGDANGDKIITLRDIAQELKEEGAQMEFISTASHEMRTPVASIEGYLGLALNPQTATIDDRARQYLEAAHTSSQHLGQLFKDLLDVTKLEDGKLKAKLVPVEMTDTVRTIAAEYESKFAAKNLKYEFRVAGGEAGKRSLNQLVYSAVDINFLREIIDNLIGNAIKYTPEGGSVWIGVRGDQDRVLINVTDSGIGIGAEDINHIFQKFYRVDNSQTREIGGTGLGLYLVKQRVEAMSGKVWAESAFGDGSTFYVSLPRLTNDEYERQRLALANEEAQKRFAEQQAAQERAAMLQQQQAQMQQVAAQAAAQAAPAAQVIPAAPAPVTAPATAPEAPAAAPATTPTAATAAAPAPTPVVAPAAAPVAPAAVPTTPAPAAAPIAADAAPPSPAPQPAPPQPAQLQPQPQPPQPVQPQPQPQPTPNTNLTNGAPQ